MTEPREATHDTSAQDDRQVELLLELSGRLQAGSEDDLDRALALATKFFGLEIGIVSRVQGHEYIVEHVHQPDGLGIEVGQRFELGQTYCNITLDAQDVVSIDEMKSSPHSGHPCYAAFGLESYLGAPLIVEGEVYGTLNFSSPAPRTRPYSETERSLVRLLARWVESSLTRLRLDGRLTDALGELDRAHRELKQRNEDLDEFAHLASHDLQAPLRNLMTIASLVEEDLGEKLTGPLADDLASIRTAAGRMQSLVRDLLELSRSGRVKLEPKEVDLDACVDQALEALASEIEGSGAELVRTPLPVAEKGQASLLVQVFQNLIGNALKYRREGQRARVEIAGETFGDSDQGVRVTVTDNGIGIDDKHAALVFAPFKRLHGAAAFEGTGLGLAISQKIVERHGGEIWFEPAPGGGSRFSFTLGVRRNGRPGQVG